jgi:hypothetical protein
MAQRRMADEDIGRWFGHFDEQISAPMKKRTEVRFVWFTLALT